LLPGIRIEILSVMQKIRNCSNFPPPVLLCLDSKNG
jgi:hypothetical protein